MMNILNIAGYKFIPLKGLSYLRDQLLEFCQNQQLKGTILISHEGININLTSTTENLSLFKNFIRQIPDFSDISFRENYSDFEPFKRLKVKIRKEIITIKEDSIQPELTPRPKSITPQELKQWLDENRDITLLDTRNDYEIRFGTFRNALNLGMKEFRDFPLASAALSKDKPIVMFCTGGIRCEKAALHLLQTGHNEVYQLHGGILNYFAEVGGEHYDGECFVFDDRVSVDCHLQVTGTKQCTQCEGPMQLTCLGCQVSTLNIEAGSNV